MLLRNHRHAYQPPILRQLLRGLPRSFRYVKRPKNGLCLNNHNPKHNLLTSDTRIRPRNGYEITLPRRYYGGCTGSESALTYTASFGKSGINVSTSFKKSTREVSTVKFWKAAEEGQ